MEAQQLGDHHYDRMKELKEFDESKAGVKGLSDSGITSIPRIFVHPPESLSDIVKKRPDDSQPSISIPVIDLSGINSPSDRPKIVDQVKQAAKEWGFFQVINHGIPLSALNDTVSAVEAFHDLPVEARARHYRRLPGSTARGVVYTSNNDLYRSAAASWDDALQVWQLPEGAEEEAAVPEVCRRELVAWFSHSTGVAEVLVELLAEGLGLERGRFKEPTSFLESRVLVGHCYPYCPEPDRAMGFASHTDAGFLTVLMENQVPGLQVKREGVWVDVKPQLGGLVVNVGDFLEILSNGEYHSVQHRVLASSSKKSRISVVVFFNLKFEDDVYYGPLPELLKPENPAIYRNFTKEDYFDNYNKRAFGNKSLVDKVKIY